MLTVVLCRGQKVVQIPWLRGWKHSYQFTSARQETLPEAVPIWQGLLVFSSNPLNHEHFAFSLHGNLYSNKTYNTISVPQSRIVATLKQLSKQITRASIHLPDFQSFSWNPRMSLWHFFTPSAWCDFINSQPLINLPAGVCIPCWHFVFFDLIDNCES